MDAEALEREAEQYLIAANDRLETEFGIGKYEHYDWDQWRGELVFSTEDVPHVVAKIQMVGSISTKSGTWLWSWANPYYMKPLTKAAHQVREFGAKHDLKELTEAKWKADEKDGWAMTAITAHHVNAKGAYRTPGENGFTYMVITDMARAKNRQSVFPTLTCVHVVHESEPVLHVSRHVDGDVVLLCGGRHETEDYCPIHLDHLLDLDPALIDLADLEPGFEADRESAEDPWKRSKLEK